MADCDGDPGDVVADFFEDLAQGRWSVIAVSPNGVLYRRPWDVLASAEMLDGIDWGRMTMWGAVSGHLHLQSMGLE